MSMGSMFDTNVEKVPASTIGIGASDESQESGKPISKIAIGSNINKDIDVLAQAIYESKKAEKHKMPKITK